MFYKTFVLLLTVEALNACSFLSSRVMDQKSSDKLGQENYAYNYCFDSQSPCKSYAKTMVRVNETYMKEHYGGVRHYDLTNSDTDYYGGWNCNHGGRMCQDSDPVVNVQFTSTPFKDTVEREHWSIKMDVRCQGQTYAFTVEFTPECGLRQRFGWYANYICHGETYDVKGFTLGDIKRLTNTNKNKSDYKVDCDSHMYADQMLNKLFQVGHVCVPEY